MPPAPAATDPIGMAWLVTVRWTTLMACLAAVLAGAGALDIRTPFGAAAGALAFIGASNLWLTWRVRHGAPNDALGAGIFIAADVILLSWLLRESGGVLNPASAFYLVQIVVTALVLGRVWTWIVTALSVGGYAMLFLSQTDELRAAQGMHPEIGTHIRGMWLAFALVAIIIGVLVTRLALAIERRDRALTALRDRTARASRAAGLASVVAGAAHELGTPLATIAVAARELEVAVERDGDLASIRDDARLIRAEIDRCRALLAGMAGRVSAPPGEAPATYPLRRIVDAVLSRLSPSERARVQLSCADLDVVWPIDVVSQAVGNVVRNGLQASGEHEAIEISADRRGAYVEIAVTDRGAGMAADVVARAGEPFFTTKAHGVGTGLGLFVSRSSIEQLGGGLEIVSAAGKGTTVTMTIPLDVVTPPGA